MDRGADVRMADTEPPFEQRLRADGADQRDAHRGGDDPAHTQAASESSMNLTKQALTFHLTTVQVAAEAAAATSASCAKRSGKGNGMSHDTLSDFVEATATKFGIPGVAVGVWADGREVYACHGVTSVDNPLPIDRDTLYVLGSVTKTYTATALMRLVAEGRVELDAPVRRYVPELVLADERAAAEVTVLHLLNDTAGL